MALKKIDATLLIEEMYKLRTAIGSTNEEAIRYWERIVELIMNSPEDTLGTRFPRLRTGK